MKLVCFSFRHATTYRLDTLNVLIEALHVGCRAFFFLLEVTEGGSECNPERFITGFESCGRVGDQLEDSQSGASRL